MACNDRFGPLVIREYRFLGISRFFRQPVWSSICHFFHRFFIIFTKKDSENRRTGLILFS